MVFAIKVFQIQLLLQKNEQSSNLVVHPYESNGSNHVFIQIIVFQIISFSIFFFQGRSNPQKYLTPTEMITSMEMLQKQLRDSASS